MSYLQKIKKSRGVLVIFCFLVSCSGEKTKKEWGILQELEGDNRGYVSKEDYFVVSKGAYDVLAVKGNQNNWVWILLNPQSEPYYKQMPEHVNFSLDRNSFDRITERYKCAPQVKRNLEHNITKQTNN